MKYISSAHHPVVAYARSLGKAHSLKKSKDFIVEGIRAAEVFFKNKFICKALLATEEYCQRHHLTHYDVAELYILPASLIQSLSHYEQSSGIIAIFQKPKNDVLEKHTLTKALILDHVQDPGNVGTLIRTAAACEYKIILSYKSAHAWSWKVIQASAGALALVDVIDVENAAEIPNYIAHATATIGLSVDGTLLQSTAVRKEQIVIVGNEGNGLSPEIKKICTDFVRLPMAPDVESLNAGVAGSLYLYQTYLSHL